MCRHRPYVATTFPDMLFARCLVARASTYTVLSLWSLLNCKISCTVLSLECVGSLWWLYNCPTQLLTWVSKLSGLLTFIKNPVPVNAMLCSLKVCASAWDRAGVGWNVSITTDLVRNSELPSEGIGGRDPDNSFIKNATGEAFGSRLGFDFFGDNLTTSSVTGKRHRARTRAGIVRTFGPSRLIVSMQHCESKVFICFSSALEGNCG